LLVLYQIDEIGDGTVDECGDKRGYDTKDRVPQGKVNYAGTFPLQEFITDILHAHKTLATKHTHTWCKSF